MPSRIFVVNYTVKVQMCIIVLTWRSIFPQWPDPFTLTSCSRRWDAECVNAASGNR